MSLSKRHIEAVLFDLGETLLNFGRLDRAQLFNDAVRQSYNYLQGLSQPVGSYRAYRRLHIWGLRWHLLRSWITGDDFNSLELLKSYGKKKGFTLSQTQWEELNWQWYRCLSPLGQVEPGTADALRQLHAMGLKVGLLSNTFVHKSSLERHLKDAGLLDLLTVRMYSYEFKFRKPNVRIFQEAARQMGVAAEQAIYVGDRMDYDVKGSMAAGMLPVLKKAYTNKTLKIPKHLHRINTIDELPGLIRRICEIPATPDASIQEQPICKES
ncbi:MAG: HAD family hydrolase [Planctomycetota bacterium]